MIPNNNTMSGIKCKAAVLWSPNQPLSIEEIEVAPPKKDEVRVKILSTSPCHRDVTVFQGKGAGHFGKFFPIILGLESSGVIESVGENVTEFAVGDMVVPTPMPYCRNCEDCKNPNTNSCSYFPENHAKGLMYDGTSRFTCKGQPVYHFFGVSSFTEYTVLSTACVAKLFSNVPADIASLFGCCLTAGYGSVVNSAKVTSGTTCVVFGLGGIGLSAVIALKYSGASKVIVVDVNEKKFELAKKLGATHCVNPKTCEDVVKTILNINGGRGCEFTFECAGTRETMSASILSTHPGYGRTTLIGLLPGGERLSVDPCDFNSGRILTGAYFGGVKMGDWVPETVENFKISGSFPMKELITHRFKFNQINEAFDAMKHGGIRSALEF